MIFASISSLSKIPSSKASFTAAKSLIGAAGAKRMSLPANSAITEGLSDLRVVAPFIAKASVKHSPRNPSSFCSRSVTTARDMETGLLRALSNAGTYRCPVITPA